MISKAASKEIVEMVTAFPTRESKRNADAMLKMILDYGHVDDEGVLSVPLEAWQIDLLSSNGPTDADLEDSDDDEDEAVP